MTIYIDNVNDAPYLVAPAIDETGEKQVIAINGEIGCKLID
jgi:hypothetical protein